MNTLQIIQTISKIGKIVSKVIFVCCIVGLCLCVVGVVGLAVGAPVLKLGGVSLENILRTEADMSSGSLYAMVAACAIVCAGEAVLAKFAARYFERELADETPFTTDGAQELMRLGILSICIPIGLQIVIRIVQTILMKVLADVEPQNPEMAGSVTLGVMVIVLSLVCRYGAELNAENAENTQTPEPEQTETETAEE